MKILSIDVGIKNLAYCLLENNDNKWKIIKWDVLNLAPTEPKCNCQISKKKTKEICNKKAKYYIDNFYFCGIHAKNSDFLIENNELKNLNSKNIDKLLEIIKKYKITTTSSKKTELLPEMKEFIKNKLLNGVNKISANDLNLIDIGISLKKELDENLLKENIDKIIIENQISPIANRMKCLQGMIAQYFIMNNKNNIEFISATNKLKAFTSNDVKTSYSERKKQSIKITNDLLDDVWSTYLNNHKKKDDLTDALLQGLWYLNNKKLIKLI